MLWHSFVPQANRLVSSSITNTGCFKVCCKLEVGWEPKGFNGLVCKFWAYIFMWSGISMDFARRCNRPWHRSLLGSIFQSFIDLRAILKIMGLEQSCGWGLKNSHCRPLFFKCFQQFKGKYWPALLQFWLLGSTINIIAPMCQASTCGPCQTPSAPKQWKSDVYVKS